MKIKVTRYNWPLKRGFFFCEPILHHKFYNFMAPQGCLNGGALISHKICNGEKSHGKRDHLIIYYR